MRASDSTEHRETPARSILSPEPPPSAPNDASGPNRDGERAAAPSGATPTTSNSNPTPSGGTGLSTGTAPSTGTALSGGSAPPAPPTPPERVETSPQTLELLAAALAIVTTDPVRARADLTKLLDGSSLDPAARARAYQAINEVNQPLFFKSGVVQGDPVFVTHRVAEGETPIFIVRAMGAKCDSELLLRVNGIADARRIQHGQSLKIPRSAFHAEVRKSEFRVNLYHGEGADRVMIASYPVGLGEFNTTPTGIFKVRPRSKLKDPQWRNPRTGEHFASADPKNPIGERWIGLEGVEPHNQDFAGYGIHGTIEPDSIGQMRSMGCIRMLGPDVEVVYEMLTVPDSTIVIAP